MIGSEPTIAAGLGDEPERRPQQQDRVPTLSLLEDRDDDRPILRRRGGQERPDGLDGKERLIAERDDDCLGVVRDRLEACLERARQSAFRSGVHDTHLRAPGDRRLDGGRVRTEDDHDLVDPGPSERVEHVLEDRPAADGGEQLPAPEARARAGCQDESDRPP